MTDSHNILIAYARPATQDRGTPRYTLEREILDGIGELSTVDFRNHGAFIEAIREASAVITSWGVRFDRDVLAEMKRCRIIAMAAVGVDMVDLDAAVDAGIVVTNAPDTFIEEVADHAMMLLLAAARRTKRVQAFAADQQWSEGRRLLMAVPRLRGATLGLLGYGNVARATTRRAKPFGLRVIAHDPYLADTVMCAEGVDPVSYDELLETSDYLSGMDDIRRQLHNEQITAELKHVEAEAKALKREISSSVSDAAREAETEIKANPSPEPPSDEKPASE